MNEKELLDILEEIFNSHNIETKQDNGWLSINEGFPAIKAYWYPDISPNAGQLTIEVFYDKDEEIIVESFGGIGKKEDRFGSALDNFMRNSLHVFLATFWDNSKEHIDIEEWDIDGESYKAYIGGYGTIQTSDFKIPDNYFDIIKETISNEKLENDTHWFNFFYGNINREDISAVALKDNDTWNVGSKAIASADWKKSDDYYSARLFIILRKEPKVVNDWNFYFCELNEVSAFIRVDLIYKDIIPLENFSKRIWINIKFQNPDNNGFASLDERNTIYTIEDNIDIALDAISIGNITINGEINLIYYTSNETNNIKNQIAEIMSDFSKYKYSISIEDDPEWKIYKDVLYPNRYEYQAILNRRVIRNLEEYGDNNEIKREINHYIFFKTEEKLNNFIKSVRKLGYKIEVYKHIEDDNYPYSVETTRVNSVEIDKVDKYVWELVQLADENNGNYDGWGCTIEK